MFCLHEVEHGASVLDDLRQLVDAFIHAFHAHALRSVELSALRVECQFERQGHGAGIIRGVRRGVCPRRGVWNACQGEAFGGESGGGYGEVEHARHGGADGALVLHVIAPCHVVGHDASLAVGGACQVVSQGIPLTGWGNSMASPTA